MNKAYKKMRELLFNNLDNIRGNAIEFFYLAGVDIYEPREFCGRDFEIVVYIDNEGKTTRGKNIEFTDSIFLDYGGRVRCRIDISYRFYQLNRSLTLYKLSRFKNYIKELLKDFSISELGELE